MFSITQKILLGAATFLALAQPARADQRGHGIGNPVPRDQMRPLAADRPDSTESAQTVDAGHIQLETDIASYLREGDRRGWAIFATNIKAGLTHNVDLQLVVTPFQRESGAGAPTLDGFGDLQLRVKINLWGNDEGDTALAVMPFVTFATASDDLGVEDFEGGLIVPFGTSVGDWGVGAQIEIDIVNEALGSGMTADFIVTAVVSHEIHGALSGFVEIFSIVAGEDDRWGGTFNAGVTFLSNPNTQLDGGVRIGLTADDPDFVIFVGVTRRF